MRAYWHENPPVHILMRAYVGYKPAEKAREMDDGSLDEFMAAISTLNGG